MRAAQPAYAWMAKDCYKSTYVYGVSLGDSSSGVSDASFSTSGGGGKLLARHATEESMLGPYAHVPWSAISHVKLNRARL